MKRLLLNTILTALGAASAFAAPDLYFTGAQTAVNGDWKFNESYKFSQSGNTYTLNLKIQPGKNFKLAANNWNPQFGSKETFGYCKAMNCINAGGNDFNIPTVAGNDENNDRGCSTTITINYNASGTTTATFVPDIYIAGNVNGWASDNNAWKLSYTANGVYSGVFSNLSGDFKLVSNDWSIQYGTPTNNLSYGTYDMVMARNGNNISLASDLQSGKVKITFDYLNRTVTFAEPGTAPDNPDVPDNPDEGLITNGPSTFKLEGVDDSWGVQQKYEFAKDGGTYTLHVRGFKETNGVKISADWNPQFGCTQTVNFCRYMPTVTGDGNNIKIPRVSLSEADARKGLNCTWILKYRGTSGSSFLVAPHLYISGKELNDWASDIDKYRMAFYPSDRKYRYRFTSFPGAIKLVTNDWSYQFGGQSTTSLNFGGDAIATSSQSFGGDITLQNVPQFNDRECGVLIFDWVEGTLKAEKETLPDLYLAGTFNSWNASANPMTREGNIYKITLPAVSGEYKITTSDWSEQIGCASLFMGYNADCGAFITGSGHNIKFPVIEEPVKNVTLIYDRVANTLRAEVNIREALYLVGDMNNWNVSEKYRFTYDEANDRYVLDTDAFSGHFRVSNYDGSRIFAPLVDDRRIETGKQHDASGDAANSFKYTHPSSAMHRAASSGRVRVIFRGEGTPNETPTSVNGIEISDEEGETVYYDLNGLRLQEPVRGIVIKKTGSKAEKVIK